LGHVGFFLFPAVRDSRDGQGDGPVKWKVAGRMTRHKSKGI
jgi:hypothetical protein